jgi:ATP-dependent Clp protease protease subunit
MAKHTGQSPERVMKDMQRDRFFRADEAKAYGIIDVVLSPASLSTAGRVGEGA